MSAVDAKTGCFCTAAITRRGLSHQLCREEDFTGLIFQNAVSGPRVKEFRINSLTPMTPEPEAESCPVREWLRSCELHGGSFIDPCGLGTLMPEEETESPEEVRSQRRRSLPNVDE